MVMLGESLEIDNGRMKSFDPSMVARDLREKMRK